MRRKATDDEPLDGLCDGALRLHRRHASRAGDPARRCCSARRPAAASRSRCRCSNRCWRCRCRKPRCGCSAASISAGARYPLTGAFETTDGAIVLVGAFKTNPLQDICKALGIADLSADPRYATFREQLAHKPQLQAMFRERFASNTTEHWLARLDEQDLLCAPVLTLARGARSRTGEGQRNGRHNAGPARRSALIGSPLSMAPDAFQLRRPPPALGADGDAVLAEAGYSPSASRRCEAR